MKWLSTSIFFIAVATFAAVSCSDDTNDTPKADSGIVIGGTGGATGAGGTTTTPGAGGTTTTPGAGGTAGTDAAVTETGTPDGGDSTTGDKAAHLAIINAAAGAGVTALDVPGPVAPEYAACK